MKMSFFRAALDSMTEGIYFADNAGLIIFWSKSAERLSGYTAQEIVGKHCSDELLLHLDRNGNTSDPPNLIAATLADGKVHNESTYLHHKYGGLISVAARSSPVRSRKGRILGAVEVFTSNTNSLSLLREVESLRKEVLTDELTRIGNRRFAETILENMVRSVVDHSVPFGVLFVDIDHFKRVNDTWGHQIGDKVLFMVAQTLVNGLRGLDVACRWGGEEFLLIVPNIYKEPLRDLGNRLRALVENSWLHHEDQRIRVTVSIGGAISREGEAVAEVIDRADKQTYRCKQAGRNCVHLDSDFSDKTKANSN